MEILRIENPESMHGMWYDSNGNFDPFIKKLSEGISKDLPMEFCADHKLDGLDWYSAGKSIEEMNQWFSARDAFELMKSGYKLFRFDVVTYQIKEHEVLFTRDGILDQQEIPLDAVWNIGNMR